MTADKPGKKSEPETKFYLSVKFGPFNTKGLAESILKTIKAMPVLNRHYRWSEIIKLVGPQ